MRIVKTLLATVGLLGLLASANVNAAALQKDLHYQLIDPAQPTQAADKVDVIEFFSYACSHCYQFEPTIDPWIKKLPKDVNFYRIPLAGGQWAVTAKLFYALEAMGVEEQFHTRIFNAIHAEKSLNPMDEASIIAWVGKNGLDQKKFTDIFKSFAIQAKTQRAVQLATAHKVDGVPTIVVDGRYVVLKNTIQSFGDLTGLTDQVIEMARSKKIAKK